MSSKPPITGTTHPLPFEQLSPLDFERLCLWLVRREGFENAEHLGAAGSEQGRDILARKDGRLFVFQCKRVKSFSGAHARKEIQKVRKLPVEKQPDEIIFVLYLPVSAAVRDAAREEWGDEETCNFWVDSELDEKVKAHPAIVHEFFQLPQEPRKQAFIHNLPLTIGKSFKGRDRDLDQLRKALETDQATAITQPQTISGLGGIGKTRLAVEYAWHARERYCAAFIVPAQGPEALHRGLSILAAPDLLNLGMEGAAEVAVEAAVLRWLREHPGWLIILDNVDDSRAAREVRSLLPHLQSYGHVLITARFSEWPDGIPTRSLDRLMMKDATSYLLDATGGRRHEMAHDSAAARGLADLLGGLPLALEQAASYIVVNGLSFEGYFDAWKTEREAVLKWYDADKTDYPVSVAVTWQHTFAQLTPTARAILRLCAHLAPDPVPIDMLTDGEPIVAEAVELLGEVTGLTVELAAVPAALAELVKYSLMTRRQSDVTVHRMVQEVVRERILENQRHEWIGKAVRLVNDFAPATPSDVRTWPIWDQLRPHAARVIELAERVGVEQPTSFLMTQLGLLLNTKSLFSVAEPLMRRSLEIDEKSFGQEHPRVAIDLNNLAHLLQATNRLSEAEPLHRRSLEIDEKSFGQEHPNVAIGLINLAHLLQATNRLSEAEPLIRRALEIDEKSFGQEHPNVAIDLNNLAGLLQDTNRLPEAEPLIRRALEIDEKSFGQEHPIIARHLNNLAQLLQATNRLSEAEPLMRRALEIDEKSFGQEHPNVAIDLNNLAHLLKATNRLSEAEPLMWRALEIDEKFFGQEHPKVATRLNNLAALLQATNRLSEAEPLMRRALEIFQASLGEDHPSAQTVQHNLDVILQALNEQAQL